MLRTTPGLGNVTVDWAIEGPFVQRTFSTSSGTLFFAKVKKINILKGLFVASQFFGHHMVSHPTLTRCF